MDGVNKTFLITAAVGAVVFTFVNVYLTNRLQKPIGNGVKQPDLSGSSWTNSGANPSFNSDPEPGVYANTPGRQGNRTSFNGQIYTDRFKQGGPHNSTVNYERSYAFQTSTKNPFANGTNNSYARAVNTATADPTNRATSLVLGPGVSPSVS
jgi:hypothetical protein